MSSDEYKNKAEMYDYMLRVALANGFSSITEAITEAAKLNRVATIEAPARRYRDQGRNMVGLWQDGVHVTAESNDNEQCPLEVGTRYKVTIERLSA